MEQDRYYAASGPPLPPAARRGLRRWIRRAAMLGAPDLRAVLDLVEEAIQALMNDEDQHALERLHVARQLLRG